MNDLDSKEQTGKPISFLICGFVTLMIFWEVEGDREVVFFIGWKPYSYSLCSNHQQAIP